MNEKNMKNIWRMLEKVKDPEIPNVSVVELGMIRNVGIESGKVYVTMTPTFIGCPAIDVIKGEITKELHNSGINNLEIKISLSNPWSSDWITSEGRKKLKEFGISPPPKHRGNLNTALSESACCPYCNSDKTVLKNSFGSTQCRAIYFCNNCQQPFEQFKPI